MPELQDSADAFEDPRALVQRTRRRMNDLVMQKYSDDDILAAAAEMGMERGAGAVMLGEVKVQRVADKRKQAMRGMTIGGLWLAGGLAITITLWITMGMGLQIRLGFLPIAYGGYQLVTNFLAHKNAKP